MSKASEFFNFTLHSVDDIPAFCDEGTRCGVDPKVINLVINFMTQEIKKHDSDSCSSLHCIRIQKVGMPVVTKFHINPDCSVGFSENMNVEFNGLCDQLIALEPNMRLTVFYKFKEESGYDSNIWGACLF